MPCGSRSPASSLKPERSTATHRAASHPAPRPAIGPPSANAAAAAGAAKKRSTRARVEGRSWLRSACMRPRRAANWA
jgi:hypothetical protein